MGDIVRIQNYLPLIFIVLKFNALKFFHEDILYEVDLKKLHAIDIYKWKINMIALWAVV